MQNWVCVSFFLKWFTLNVLFNILVLVLKCCKFGWSTLRYLHYLSWRCLTFNSLELKFQDDLLILWPVSMVRMILWSINMVRMILWSISMVRMTVWSISMVRMILWLVCMVIMILWPIYMVRMILWSICMVRMILWPISMVRMMYGQNICMVRMFYGMCLKWSCKQ